jgi:hypothetical protein
MVQNKIFLNKKNILKDSLISFTNFFIENLYIYIIKRVINIWKFEHFWK